MSVDQYCWVDSDVTMGWRLIVRGIAFGRVVWRQGEYRAQVFELRNSSIRTLAASKDPDEMFDYLLSLARLRCSVT
jgi:hypothetical protein